MDNTKRVGKNTECCYDFLVLVLCFLVQVLVKVIVDNLNFSDFSVELITTDPIGEKYIIYRGKNVQTLFFAIIHHLFN